MTLSDVSMRSQTLRYHGLSHIASASWGCYALYGAQCRSLSFSLLSRLWFWRSLTLETQRWPVSPAFCRFNWTACRRSWMQRLDEDKSLWSYRSANTPPALASCAAAAAHIFQAYGTPVRPWTWTGLYLADALQPVSRIPGRQRLRSSSTIGDRAFPVASARKWNSLSAEVTSSNTLQTFKTKLKSHIFLASFP